MWGGGGATGKLEGNGRAKTSGNESEEEEKSRYMIDVRRQGRVRIIGVRLHVHQKIVLNKKYVDSCALAFF